MYGCLKNPDLDERARVIFRGGLGSMRDEIERQVDSVGRDYGGVAGYKAAYVLAHDIARDIFANRQQFEQAALAAAPILTQIPSRASIETLYRPFVQPLDGKSN